MRAAIFLMDACIGSVIHGILDALIAANYSLIKSGQSPLFKWNTVSVDGEPVTPINGLKIAADMSIEQYQASPQQADVWILPAFFNSASDYRKIEQAIARAAPVLPVIRQHHEQGGMLVSVCSGSFLLAAAGLMGNRPACMHWQLEPHFRRMFPELKINTQQAIGDYGNIISTVGGAVAYEHLMMHLVGRFAGHGAAVNTARLLMMNLAPPNPLPFRIDAETLPHGDALVHRAQRHIEQHCDRNISIQGLAQDLNISERQLNRRFLKTLDLSPLQYLQRIRLKRACNLLESGNLPSNKIVYEVGYLDESSFRRLFKKQMGMTMEDYRAQFGIGAIRPQQVHPGDLN